jgi:tRNA-specific 2-thiouridylase
VAIGHRAYVVGIDAETATVRLGARDELLATGAVVAPATLADDVTLPVECEVAVRYRAIPVPALVTARAEGGLEISFREAVYAVVKGQYAVMYRGDRVLGGGLICAPLHGGAA